MKLSRILLTTLLSLAVAGAAQAMDMKHQARGVACADCHKTAAPASKPKAKVCFDCHDYDDLAKRSAAKGLALNPHDSHAGQIKCILCHREHKPSVVYCKSCHKSGDQRFEFNVP